MRELGKMAELSVEAPLAKFDQEDWLDFSDFQASQDAKNSNKDESLKTENLNKILEGDNGATTVIDNFDETFSGSLEDLVTTFDEKITKCFSNYEQNVEKLAPVQVRTQEEIMNECQMWWTITGNFGNILPIDWSKSFARQLHMPALNLTEKRKHSSEEDELASEDEAVASDLDMHSLILNGLQQQPPPIKTAEEVLQEIDDIMDESNSVEDALDDDSSSVALKKQSRLHEENLKCLSLCELNEKYSDLEEMIRLYSETLIAELALRDELEWEKELKNQFISLVLAVQNRRRQVNTEKKKRVGANPKHITTIIPYHAGTGPPNNRTLQVLIKILKAINEDSPTVPTLLTDYILKVLCPS